MKTKSRKVICVALAVLLIFALSMAITGCGEKEPEYPEYEPPKNCDIVLEDGASLDWEEPYENFITICDTYEELQEELSRHGIEMFEESAIKVREYADEHEDKSFVVCFYVLTSYNGPHRLREVEVNDGKLTLYIWHSKYPISSTVMGSCLFIAGVDKSFVANVTECEYVFV